MPDNKPLTFIVTNSAWFLESGTRLSPVYMLPPSGGVVRVTPGDVISAAMSGQPVELRRPTQHEYTKYLEHLVTKHHVPPLTEFSPDDDEEEEEEEGASKSSILVLDAGFTTEYLNMQGGFRTWAVSLGMLDVADGWPSVAPAKLEGFVQGKPICFEHHRTYHGNVIQRAHVQYRAHRGTEMWQLLMLLP